MYAKSEIDDLLTRRTGFVGAGAGIQHNHFNDPGKEAACFTNPMPLVGRNVQDICSKAFALRKKWGSFILIFTNNVLIQTNAIIQVTII